MSDRLPRRQFLQAASAMGLGAGLGPWEALRVITPASAEEARVDPEMVRFRPEIEPVVRWIEETPREQILDKAVAELKDGLSYRSLLSALFLAGIRNIKPRPVGFKFHAVMVINSAHLLGQSAAVTERLLPLFWALDNFKSSQAADVREGDWSLGRVDESRVPKPHRARADYIQAMEAWDEDAADAAVAGLCRGSGAAETMEPIWRMAVRDQRNIGHKPIFAAQSWRTLQAIGWEHAEPVLRSLTFGLLDLQGDRPKPLGPYEANLENARKVRDDWQVGRPTGATKALLQTIRQASPEAASAEAAKMLNPGSRRIALGCRGALGQRADDPQPRHRRHPRHDRGELPALHLPRQRRRPHRRLALFRPWAGSRSIAIGSRPEARRDRRDAADGPSRRRRGRRRDLRDHQRRSRPGRGQDPGLPGPRRLGRARFRCRPADDLPQGNGQPRLQVRGGDLGGDLVVSEPRWHARSWPRPCSICQARKPRTAP